MDGDELLFVIADARHAGGKPDGAVVGTVMTNRGLEVALRSRGIGLHRARVGDRHVLEMMRSRGCMIGGESSGHLICLDRSTTGDGIVAALQVLHALAQSGRTLHEAKQGMSKFPQALRNVRIAKPIDLDSDCGLNDMVAAARAELGEDGRVLLRESGHRAPGSHHGREHLARRRRKACRPARGRRLRRRDRGVVNAGEDIHRHVFFVSDSTGITVETLGSALLSQFDHVQFITTTIPFVTDATLAIEVVARIDAVAGERRDRPLVFSTLADSGLREILARSNALVLDIFQAFIGTLEQELDIGSSHALGRFHAVTDKASYEDRIGAVEFALSHDDGAGLRSYGEADVILVGVSRSRQDADLRLSRDAVRNQDRELPVDRRGPVVLFASAAPARPSLPALRAHHRSGAAAKNSLGAATRYRVLVSGTLSHRGSRGRGAVRASPDPLPRYERRIDRGDRLARAAAHRTAPARLLIRTPDMDRPDAASFGWETLAGFAARYPAGTRFVVAFSGGADSLALLHAFTAARAHGHAPNLHAIHVDHHLHRDSTRWAHHCAEICRRLSVELTVLDAHVEEGESGARRRRRGPRGALPGVRTHPRKRGCAVHRPHRGRPCRDGPAEPAARSRSARLGRDSARTAPGQGVRRAAGCAALPARHCAPTRARPGCRRSGTRPTRTSASRECCCAAA